AEDRERFQNLIGDIGLQQPNNATVPDRDSALNAAQTVGYPLVTRPSYVLGGRAMEIVHNEEALRTYLATANIDISDQQPLLLDQYLKNAVEVDVDAICDGTRVFIAGVMEHIEEAGVHSGDSACALPPYTLSTQMIAALEDQTRKLGMALNVVGLMNVQFAIQGETIFVLEVNPRASRTVPFVAKTIGLPVARLAAKVMAGTSLDELGLGDRAKSLGHTAVKEVVFPFARFSGVDTVLGPEMRSTGEVMGLDTGFAKARAKSLLAAGAKIPIAGCVFISLKDGDKKDMVGAARDLLDMGFSIIATAGTASFFNAQGLAVTHVNKVLEGRPHIVDALKNGEVQMVFNTTEGAQSVADSQSIRTTALYQKIPCITTAAGARAAVRAIAELRKDSLDVLALQSYGVATR
ncbi:MAG: ATP-grasp domain-containing protein, partial [Pseudomonadota bacterium]